MIFNITKHLSLDGGYDVYVVLNKDSEIEEFKSLDVRIVTNPCNADSAAMESSVYDVRLSFYIDEI